MTINLSTFRTQLKNLLPDIPTAEIAVIDLDQQVKQAVRLYSLDLPDDITEDVTGDGGQYYDISLLTQWQDGFSNILTIQYPAPDIATDETPTYLEPEDWDTSYYVGNTRYLYLPNHSIAGSDAMRIKYTGFYKWTASSTTTTQTQTAHGFSVDDQIYQEAGTWYKDASGLIATHIVTAAPDADNFTAAELAANVPPAHFFAICHKAACLTCYAIAAKYSRTSDSTISADSVNHPTRAEQFSARAKEYCRMYTDTLGIGGGADGQGNAGTAEFVDWDTAPGWPTSRDYIFHGRHTR